MAIAKLILNSDTQIVIKNEEFETLYVAPDEPEENDNSPEESQSLFSN